MTEQPATSDTASPTVTRPRALLSIDNVEVRFGGIRALNGVGFDVGASEVVGVMGPNGAGKTTLFDVISGVRTPHQGRIELGGEDITNLSATQRARRGLRRTFQRVQAFGWLSVEDNILAATEWAGGGGGFLGDVLYLPSRRSRERERRAKVDEIIERCGLGAVRKELAGSLPIGITRMVELARAIVDPPKILLLDEPASGLDEVEHHRLGEQIQRARNELGCGVLLVEHNAGFLVEQSDRIVVLDQGAVLFQGTPNEVVNSAVVRDAYLGGQMMPTDSAEVES